MQWLGLGLFKEFNMTHQLNRLFHFLSTQEERYENPGDSLIKISTRGFYLKV